MKKLQVDTGRFRSELPSNVLLVVELVTMVRNFLIEKIMINGIIGQNKILEERMKTKEASTLTKIVIIFQMGKKVILIKNINYLGHLKVNVLMRLMMFLWMP